jgi:hypothetical protein
MKTVKTLIERASDGSYSVYMKNPDELPYGLIGVGDSVSQAIDDWNSSYQEMHDLMMANGEDFVEANFTFSYDVPSFLAYYGGLLTFKGLAKLTGVSAAQLSQYATGYRNPSPKTTAKIQAGLHAFASDLAQVSLI